MTDRRKPMTEADVRRWYAHREGAGDFTDRMIGTLLDELDAARKQTEAFKATARQKHNRAKAAEAERDQANHLAEMRRVEGRKILDELDAARKEASQAGEFMRAARSEQVRANKAEAERDQLENEAHKQALRATKAEAECDRLQTDYEDAVACGEQWRAERDQLREKYGELGW